MSNKTELQANNIDLQELIDLANSLPDAIELPELTNVGSSADLLVGKQLIDNNQTIITGTMPSPTETANITLTTADGRKVVEGRSDQGTGYGWSVVNSDGVHRICTAIDQPGYYPQNTIVALKASNLLPDMTTGTATATDIISGKTAWVNGNKLTGTMSKGYSSIKSNDLEVDWLSNSEFNIYGFQVADCKMSGNTITLSVEAYGRYVGDGGGCTITIKLQ